MRNVSLVLGIVVVGACAPQSPQIGSRSEAMLTTAAIPLSAAPAALATGYYPGVAIAEPSKNLLEYVGRSAQGAITLIGNTPVGKGPQGVAEGTFGEITSANGGDNTLSVFVPSTASVATVSVGPDPIAIVYSAADQQSFTLNHGNETISANSESSSGSQPYGQLYTIPVGKNPVALAFDRGSKTLFVSNHDDGTIGVVSHLSQTMRTMSLGSGANPQGIAVNAVTRRLWVAVESLNEALGIPIDDPTLPTVSVAVGNQPRGIAVNEADNQVFVTSPIDNTVTIIDGAFGTVTHVVPVGQTPVAVAVDLKGVSPAGTPEADVYVANAGDSSLTTFVDPAMSTAVIRVPVLYCATTGSQYGANLQGINSLISVIENADSSFLAYGGRVVFQPVPLPAGTLPLIPGDDLDSIPGSVLFSAQHGNTEHDRCLQAWQELSPSARGIPLIAASTIVGVMAAGFAAAPATTLAVNTDGTKNARTNDLCTHPRTNLQTGDFVGTYALIQDPFPTMQAGFSPTIVAEHELGHTLFLGHGYGIDEDKNGTEPPVPGYRDYDSYCDTKGYNPATQQPIEDIGVPGGCPDATSVMDEGGSCPSVHPLQIEQLEDDAAFIPGVAGSADPAGFAINDVTCSSPPCGLPGDVALQFASVSETPGSGITTLIARVFGAPAANTEYSFVVDLDDDPTTGCAASTAGVGSSFVGAELIAQVSVSASPTGTLVASPNIFTCNGSAFALASTNGVVASTYLTREAESLQSGNGVIDIRIPDSIRGSMGTAVRLEVLAQELSGQLAVDTLPHASADSGVTMGLIPANLPSCSISPNAIQPGIGGSVAVSGLPPNMPIVGILSGQTVANANTDKNGGGLLSFTVPSNTPPGLKLFAVQTTNVPAVALCAVLVESAPATPYTVATVSPNPDFFGWNNSAVTVSLQAYPAPGGASISDIDYALSGAQVLPETHSSSSPVSLSVVNEGQTTVSFFATDSSGLSETHEAQLIQIDETAPSIVGTALPSPNSAGWNNSPVTISFKCTDALSGIASCSPATTISTEGQGEVATGVAVDRAQNRSATQKLINLDMTPPVVLYSGNAGSYTVDQSVSITCTATDNLSGIATTTCANITGPAYTFAIGNNTYSASAADFAGNTGSATTSFTVTVTYDSLCNLTTNFSSNAGVSNALCQKLANAKAAYARGNQNAKTGMLNAFANQVSAQTGKALTAAQANVLSYLVTFL
jgi:YVTN family beta-propeller protein